MNTTEPNEPEFPGPSFEPEIEARIATQVEERVQMAMINQQYARVMTLAKGAHQLPLQWMLDRLNEAPAIMDQVPGLSEAERQNSLTGARILREVIEALLVVQAVVNRQITEGLPVQSLAIDVKKGEVADAEHSIPDAG